MDGKDRKKGEGASRPVPR